MNNIKKHIRENDYRHAYLLYGEEDYIKINYRNMLRNGITGEDTMNYSYYEGKNPNTEEISDLSRTMPFFAERRLIIMEDSGLFKTTSDDMVKIIKEAPDTTYFVFVEKEADRRNKLYKYIAENGYVCEIKNPGEDDVIKWILTVLSKNGKKITGNNMKLLLSVTGCDMNNVRNETDKLIDYTYGREEITAEDINAMCVPGLQDRVFDMIEAIAVKDRDRVIKLYGELLALKEPPMKILVLIGRQFAVLMAVKEMAVSGNPNAVIAEKLGIRPFLVSKYVKQAQKFSAVELRQGIEDCVNADNDVKTGKIEDKYAVELIIMKYCTQ